MGNGQPGAGGPGRGPAGATFAVVVVALALVAAVPAALPAALPAAAHAAHQPGTGYRVLVMLHLLCVIGGFGFLAYNGAALSLTRRRGGGVSSGALAVNRDLSQLAELLIIGAFVFGVAAVGSSNKAITFGQGWVVGATVGWVVDLGLLHGFIRPRQRRYLALAGQVAEAPKEGGRPPEIAVLDQLERSIALGWGAFNLVVLVVVYLMVFQPGS